MSRCRESSGASFGSQITPPAESSCGKAWASMASRRKSSMRRVPADVALADERRAVDAAEHHLVAADVHGVGRVAGLHVELARRLGHLLQHELRVEPDDVVLDLLARPAEQLHRLRLGELHADLGDDPPPALVQHGDGVRRRGSRSAASCCGTCATSGPCSVRWFCLVSLIYSQRSHLSQNCRFRTWTAWSAGIYDHIVERGPQSGTAAA